MTPLATAVGHLTWDQVAARLEAGALAILPCGAGSKQHGFHMPMMTDQLTAEYFAAALAGQITTSGGALIWPTITYGFYPAFAAYAGSVSLPEPLFRALIAAVVQGLLDHGARQVVIVDAGLSTRRPIEDAITAHRWAGRVSRLGLFDGAHFVETAERHKRQLHGTHADEIESSLMLALYPELVAMERAVASPPLANGPVPGPLEPANPSSSNFSPSGSFGDPTLATRELGEWLIAAILADLSGWTAACLRVAEPELRDEVSACFDDPASSTAS